MAIFCGSTYVFGVVSLIREIRGNGQFLSRRLYNEHDRDEQVVVVVDGWEVFLRAENPPKWTTAYEEAQVRISTIDSFFIHFSYEMELPGICKRQHCQVDEI